jgi:mannose-6-phosphate isomerase
VSEAALRRAAGDLLAWTADLALPLWWRSGADLAAGGFFEALEHDGTPAHRPRRARVQTRQIYCYAATSQLCPFDDRERAVDHGLDYFLNHYRRPDGLHRTLVTQEGAPLDDQAYVYDQAFALLALAEARRGAPERESLRLLAAQTLAALEALRLPEGGFREASENLPFQSNPHMHLFEAALAWEEVDGDPAWGVLADEIGTLCLTQFIDANGALHEYFAEGWAPAPGLEGRIVEPGHQFEWSWLLKRWGSLRGRDDALGASERLFAIGLTHGVDQGRGVAFDQLLDDMSVHSSVARLWPQTERIKAALVFWETAPEGRRKDELAMEVVRAIAGLNLYLATAIPGLWRDKLLEDGRFVEEPAPASSFYHIVCAVLELRRALGPEVQNR